MSLRVALLGILTAEPMTGYDLVKYFDGTVGFVWSAPHSQIYPELRRMEAGGLVRARVVPRGQRATKRIYEITDNGRRELQAWVAELQPVQPERDVARLKAAYFEWGSYDAARRQLQEHLRHYTEYLREREQIVSDIDALRVPLLRRRVETRGVAESQAIIAFKRLAFEGGIAHAKAEIEWATRGLAMIDELERIGGSVSVPEASPRPQTSTRAERARRGATARSK